MVRTVFEKADAIPLVAEVFREFGYEGASMSAITERTKLSKGSLYHFFPGGKEEMAAEIIAHVDAWFAREVFVPLETKQAEAAIAIMWEAVRTYFRSGRRICLIGAFAIDATRDRFSETICAYFERWIAALEGALLRCGLPAANAKDLAEDCVVGIQGALTLARALNGADIFDRTIGRLAHRVDLSIQDRKVARKKS